MPSTRTMQRIKKLCFRILRGAVVGLLLLIATACTYAYLNAPYYNRKYAAIPQQVSPIHTPASLTPIEQREGHTCGFLALSSLYVAYGLDPVESDLRFRLGVDKTAVPLATGTEGTLHPDLLRVASQDGLNVRILDPQSSISKRVLLEHLAGNAALALVTRSGGLHWIALDNGGDYDELRVSDSLEAEAYLIKAKTLLAQPVLSLLLFRPSASAAAQDINALHTSGLLEMTRVQARMNRLDE